jgi:hypothetical protein
MIPIRNCKRFSQVTLGHGDDRCTAGIPAGNDEASHVEQSIHENPDRIFGEEKKARPWNAAPKKK